MNRICFTLFFLACFFLLSSCKQSVDSVQPATTVPVQTDTTAPGNPTNITAQAGNGQVTLSWTNPGDSDFNGVVISWTPTGGSPSQPVSLTASATSQVITGLTNNTAYTFTIKATDLTGNISTGVTATKTPAAPDTTAPGNPTNITAQAGNGQVTLSWTNPGDSDFNGVVISWTPTGGSPSQPVPLSSSATSQVITGLTNNTAYTFTMKATDLTGNISTGGTITRTPYDSGVGGLTVTINPPSNTTFSLTIPSVKASYASAETLAVTPVISAIADQYKWYLNGKILPDQTSLAINLNLSTFPKGTLQFTLIAVKGSLIASGNFTITVQ